MTRRFWMWALVLSLGCATTSPRPSKYAAHQALTGGDPNRHVAIVLLPRPELPAAEAVVKAHRELAPREAELAIQQARIEGKQGGVGSQFTLGKAQVGVLLLPEPMPQVDIERTARHSASFLAREWNPAPHQAMLVIVLNEAPGIPPQETQRRFTHLVGAVTRAASAPSGVFWASANATHDPAFLAKVAGQKDAVRLAFLWVGLEVYEDAPGRVRVESTGMKSLALPELVLTAPLSSTPKQVLTNAFDLISYVVGRGEALPEGDTVGWEQQEQIPVRYEASAEDAKEQVLRIDLN
jgi:Domain of unknown function (DUF4261)